MTIKISELLEQYNTAKSKMSHYQAEEKKLRLKVVDMLFPNAIEGTHNLEKSEFQVKGVFKMNHRIDAKALLNAEDSLNEYEKECIVYKPSLSLKKYKELPEADREALDELIITTPALPSITITALEEQK